MTLNISDIGAMEETPVCPDFARIEAEIFVEEIEQMYRGFLSN